MGCFMFHGKSQLRAHRLFFSYHYIFHNPLLYYSVPLSFQSWKEVEVSVNCKKCARVLEVKIVLQQNYFMLIGGYHYFMLIGGYHYIYMQLNIKY